MSESKHTPGPWTVDGPPQNQIVWSSAENRVCFLAHTNGLDDERDLATGRLIAAAPDLYKALRGLLDELTALMGESEGVAGLHLNGDIAPWSELSPGGAYEHLGQINAAYDALAKAEGRS